MRALASRVEATALAACPVCAGPPASVCEWHLGPRTTPACPCIVRCPACGHRFRAHPAEALLRGAVYDARYHDNRQTQGTPGFIFKRATFALHLRELARACDGIAGKRLLDVGCATGDFLAMAAAAGVDVHGVDVSVHAAARAAERGFRSTCGRIDDVAGGPYDLLHSSHVLEHVPNARAFAWRAFELLRPGGVALIEVPNEFENLLSVLPRLAGRRERRRFDAPHLHYFGARSLAALFRERGFVVRRLFTYSHRRLVEGGAGFGSILRHVRAPNALLRLGDQIGRGRNLVLLAERPA